jgi:hypothetical protein
LPVNSAPDLTFTLPSQNLKKQLKALVMPTLAGCYYLTIMISLKNEVMEGVHLLDELNRNWAVKNFNFTWSF